MPVPNSLSWFRAMSPPQHRRPQVLRTAGELRLGGEHLVEESDEDDDLPSSEMFPQDAPVSTRRAPKPKQRVEVKDSDVQANCLQSLPLDSRLFALAGMDHADPGSDISSVDIGASASLGRGVIHNLLCKGANPCVHFPDSTGTVRTAGENAARARDSSQQRIDDLLAHRLCHHMCCDHMFAGTPEEARRHAGVLLDDLAALEEHVALLKAAAQVWSKATPSKHMLCSTSYLYGRGVLLPDFGELHAALAAVPSKRVPSSEDIQAVADALRSLAEAESKEDRRSQLELCCPIAEQLGKPLALGTFYVFFC